MTKINQRNIIYDDGKKKLLIVCNGRDKPKMHDLKNAIYLKEAPKPIFVKKYKKRLKRLYGKYDT